MALRVVVSYIAQVSPSASKERLMRLIPTDVEEVHAIMPTLFEKERQEGVLTGQREMIKKLLRQRFGELPSAIVQQIEQADAPSLERWADRFLKAPTLAAVFE